MSDDRHPPFPDDRTSACPAKPRAETEGDGILATIKTTYRKFVRPFAKDDDQESLDALQSKTGDDPSRG